MILSDIEEAAGLPRLGAGYVCMKDSLGVVSQARSSRQLRPLGKS